MVVLAIHCGYKLVMNKKSSGFSYIEILITLTLFSVLIIVVLPTLLQGGRNMNFAETNYKGHLIAQEIMLITRDTIKDGENIESAITYHAILR